MKKRFINRKLFFSKVLAGILAFCLSLSMAVIPATAFDTTDSFDVYRVTAVSGAYNVNDLYFANPNHPYKTILEHNYNSPVIAQWEAQYVDTTNKCIALTEAYLYDVFSRAYSASTHDPYVAKCIQARQGAVLDAVARSEGITVAACAARTIAAMSDADFEDFRNELSMSDDFPEWARTTVLNFRTLNETVEDFLFAVAAIEELNSPIQRIGRVLHHACTLSGDNDFETASMRIEQYTDFAGGNPVSYYTAEVQNICNMSVFDPDGYSDGLTDSLWGNICTDLSNAFINVDPTVKGMFRQSNSVSNNVLLDDYYEMGILASVTDYLKQRVHGYVSRPITEPMDEFCYYSYKTHFAAEAIIADLTVDYTVNAVGSGLYISAVEGDPLREQEYFDRLNSLAGDYSYLGKALERNLFNSFLGYKCWDAAPYLNIQSEPPGQYDNIGPVIDDIILLSNTTGDIYIRESTVFTEDYDIYGNLYILDSLSFPGHTITVEGGVYQNEGDLIPAGGSLKTVGDYVITNNGCLIMVNSSDLVTVGGKFVMQSNQSHDNLLSDGVLTIGGDFVQDGHPESFKTSGVHRTVFNGSGAQHISFDNIASGFTELELQNSNIFFDSKLRSLDLCCDLAVSNDWHWQGGDLNLNGYVLTVSGNFIFDGDNLKFNDGILKTGGDFTLTGTARMVMLNPSDRLDVYGSFLTETQANETGLLTDGVITVKGNFKQRGDPQSFAASGNHVVVLDGMTPTQHVRFSNSTSRFNTLKLYSDMQTECSFNPNNCWNNLILVPSVANIYMNPLYQNLVYGGHMNLNAGISGRNLSNPAYTLSLSGNTSANTYIDSNGVLYIGSDEQSQLISVTITSVDTPSSSVTRQIGLTSQSNIQHGDLNFDGGLTINDATLLQQNLAEFIEFMSAQDTLADFNNDGFVNVRDVTSIQRRLAGLG